MCVYFGSQLLFCGDQLLMNASVWEDSSPVRTLLDIVSDSVVNYRKQSNNLNTRFCGDFTIPCEPQSTVGTCGDAGYSVQCWKILSYRP